MARLWSWAESPSSSSDGGGHQQQQQPRHQRFRKQPSHSTSPPRRPRLSSRDAPATTTTPDHHHSSKSQNQPAHAHQSALTSHTSQSPHHPQLDTRDDSHSQSQSSAPSSPSRQRVRMNSRDIARSYSGLYGYPDDLLPLEINQPYSKVGLSDYTNSHLPLVVYLSLTALLQFLSLLVLEFEYSWTLTNFVHLIVTLIVIHWLKGSIYDSQGEMSYLTVWEQLEATSGREAADENNNDDDYYSSNSEAGGTNLQKMCLLIVPTLLCYAGCHFSNYDSDTCLANVIIWAVAVLAKLPFMNGVRLFGINRTVGIDDETVDEVVEGSSTANTNRTTTGKGTTNATTRNNNNKKQQ